MFAHHHPRRHHHPSSCGSRSHRGRSGFRPFDQSEFRLLLLRLIADTPRHGYELMKAVEEMAGGAYAPSPGVIYPTLALLEEMGLIAASPEAGGRKRYAITPEGEASLRERAAEVAALMARLGGTGQGPAAPPASLLRAMENLRLAVRLRLARGALPAETAHAVAAALDEAARLVERS